MDGVYVKGILDVVFRSPGKTAASDQMVNYFISVINFLHTITRIKHYFVPFDIPTYKMGGT